MRQLFSADPDLAKMPILVVDDETQNTVLLTRLLGRAGFDEVIATNDAAEAMALFDAHRPDLVLVDLHMPGKDGFDLLETFRQRIGDREYLPLMVLTADGSDAAKTRALQVGADDFVAKPFDFPELVLRVANLLRTRALYSQLRHHDDEVEAEVRELEADRCTARADRERIHDQITGILAGHTDRMAMVFQPIVDLSTGGLAGAEALARFEGPPHQPTEVWFAQAARVGQGTQIEALAASLAVAALDSLPAPAFLSVNASPDFICSPELRDIVDQVDGYRLVIELTEHGCPSGIDALRRAVARLRADGVRLAVDDTGAGHASLRHIFGLCPDLIKFDRSLIQEAASDAARRALVHALVHLAAEIDASVIAEGIETGPELDLMRELGIALGQGFYLGEPRLLPVQSRFPVVEPAVARPSALP